MKDSSQFNTTIQSFQPMLKYYALQLTHNLDDAMDLVQETFLKAMTYSSKFKEGTNLKGWLFTIMRNTFINNYRRVTKRNTFMDTQEEQYIVDSAKTFNTFNDRSEEHTSELQSLAYLVCRLLLEKKNKKKKKKKKNTR